MKSRNQIKLRRSKMSKPIGPSNYILDLTNGINFSKGIEELRNNARKMHRTHNFVNVELKIADHPEDCKFYMILNLAFMTMAMKIKLVQNGKKYKIGYSLYGIGFKNEHGKFLLKLKDFGKFLNEKGTITLPFDDKYRKFESLTMEKIRAAVVLLGQHNKQADEKWENNYKNKIQNAVQLMGVLISESIRFKFAEDQVVCVLNGGKEYDVSEDSDYFHSWKGLGVGLTYEQLQMAQQLWDFIENNRITKSTSQIMKTQITDARDRILNILKNNEVSDKEILNSPSDSLTSVENDISPLPSPVKKPKFDLTIEQRPYIEMTKSERRASRREKIQRG
jgi:hypothetical protein